ncbi:hypothetical protein ncot_01710 [Nocardioides sp. JQ2195]|uniref:hypothetical protein n=1 Tax=Nocardioides sp. JQ2195 TaxID=2592334 RepID=UPI00143EEACF|nr:hypothetical protein [Nocardioides sp. JQ2195]QIX25446.1 hypothetical protein ncot_01710 [Nocardioides sp. JQ2195]
MSSDPSSLPPSPRTKPSGRWLVAGWASICVAVVLLVAAAPLIWWANSDLAHENEHGDDLGQDIAFMVLALVVLFALFAAVALLLLLVGVLVRGNTRVTRVLIGLGVSVTLLELVLAAVAAFLVLTEP